MYRFFHKKEGFTLIEMLVAIASGMIILTVLFSIVIIMTTSQRNALAKKELSNNARIILETVTRHIRLASKDLNIESFQNTTCVENNFYFATFDYYDLVANATLSTQEVEASIANKNYIQFLSTIDNNQCIRFYANEHGELVLSTKTEDKNTTTTTPRGGIWEEEVLTSQDEIVIDSLKFKVLKDNKLNHPTVLIYLKLSTVAGDNSRFKDEISLKLQTSITPRNIVSRRDIVQNRISIVDVYITKKVNRNQCSYIFEVRKDDKVSSVDVEFFSEQFPKLPATPSNRGNKNYILKTGESIGSNVRQEVKNCDREFINYESEKVVPSNQKTYFFEILSESCDKYNHFRLKVDNEKRWTEGYPHNIENVIGNFLYDEDTPTILGVDNKVIVNSLLPNDITATVKIEPMQKLADADVSNASYNIKYCEQNNASIENCFDDWSMLKCDVEAANNSTQLKCYHAFLGNDDESCPGNRSIDLSESIFAINDNNTTNNKTDDYYAVDIKKLNQASRYIFEVNAEYTKEDTRRKTAWDSEEIATNIDTIDGFEKNETEVNVQLEWQKPNTNNKTVKYTVMYKKAGEPQSPILIEKVLDSTVKKLITQIPANTVYSGFEITVEANVPLSSDSDPNSPNTVSATNDQLTGFKGCELSGFKYYIPPDGRNIPVCGRIGFCPPSCSGSSGSCRKTSVHCIQRM